MIHLPPPARGEGDHRCNGIVCKGQMGRTRCKHQGKTEVAGKWYCHVHAEQAEWWQEFRAASRKGRGLPP